MQMNVYRILSSETSYVYEKVEQKHQAKKLKRVNWLNWNSLFNRYSYFWWPLYINILLTAVNSYVLYTDFNNIVTACFNKYFMHETNTFDWKNWMKKQLLHHTENHPSNRFCILHFRCEREKKNFSSIYNDHLILYRMKSLYHTI